MAEALDHNSIEPPYMSDILASLHPRLRRLIYSLGWKSLRPVQVEMISAWNSSHADLLACAQTASGKTEGAFIPGASELLEHPVAGFGALWISPLRSLINDCYVRLQPLGESLDLMVSRWHGEVSQSEKNRIGKNPEGLHLTTPESLEAKLILHPDWVRKSFANVRFVVVDEVHSMLDVERGQHLSSLLYRLSRLIGRRPRFVGLSASLGDFVSARRFLNPENPGSVTVIDCSQDTRKMSVAVVGRLLPTPSVRERGTFVSLTPDEALSLAESLRTDLSPASPMNGMSLPRKEKAALGDPYAHILSDIIHVAKKGSNLVFFNRRALLEWFADRLKLLAKEHGLPEDAFHHHHSSLSTEVRETAERLLKVAHYITVLATSSLELGIDMQSVKYVFQVMATFTVMSLLQRLGRSGRKEAEIRRVREYTLDRSPSENADLTDLLYPELLRGIAVVELALRGELEPSPSAPKLHLSTAVHQVLAVVRQEMQRATPISDKELIEWLGGSFRRLDWDLFLKLLETMIKRDLLTRTVEGQIVLGEVGEELACSHEFFAVFSTEVEFEVVNGAQFIGTLPVTPFQKEGSEVILDGRRWVICRINRKARRIYVEASDRADEPTFLGRGGDIHDIIIREIRAVLSRPIPAYLEPETAKLLQAAQTVATKAGILQRRVIVSDRGIHWFPWVGTAAMLVLRLAAEHQKLKTHDHLLAIYFPGLSLEQFASYLQPIAEGQLDGRRLAALLPEKKFERFDEFLSDDLLCISIAADRLNMQSAEAAAKAALEEMN